MNENDILIKDCKDAEEFLYFSRPENPFWKNSPLSNWIFRGQRDSNWHLEPKAFRKNSTVYLSYTNYAFTSPFKDVKDQCRHEFYLIHDFLLNADKIGLTIPGDHLIYRIVKNLLKEVYNSFDKLYWPPDKLIEPLALGQHHGVPTRFIDFSENPLVAAFFASYFAFYYTYEQSEKFKKDLNKTFCIWGINLARLNQITDLEIPRVFVARVPYASNKYLQRQKGLFLYDAQINNFWNEGNPPFLDDVLLELSNNKSENDSNQPILVKFNLPIYPFAQKVLKLLEEEGLTIAYLMPTFDNVVRNLEFYRCLHNQPSEPPIRII